MELAAVTPNSTERASPSSAYRSVLDLLAQMRDLAKDPIKFDRISDELATLSLAYMTPAHLEILPGSGITQSEGKVLAMLQAKLGQTVRKTAIYNGLYFATPDASQPEMKTVDVFVCKLRQKLKSFQAPYFIETQWGEGYRLMEITTP